MTGKQYEKKGLRRLESKYPMHRTYLRRTEMLENAKQGTNSFKVSFIENLIEKMGEEYNKWHEEYLDLQEIVAGFAK